MDRDETYHVWEQISKCLTMYDTDTIIRQSDQRNIACRPETDAIIYISI